MNKLNRETFFGEIKQKLFTNRFSGKKGALQIQGIDLMIDAWEARPNLNLQDFAYILATVYHETAGTMQPIKEMGGVKYLKGKPYYPYFGRGYVQLTWLENYKKASEKYGVDFVNKPDQAMLPKYAIPILFDGMAEGWFTGVKLRDFIDEKDESDEEDYKEYQAARKVVNGKDRDELIAGYATIFEKALYKAYVVNIEPIQKDNATLVGTTAAGAGGITVLGDGINGIADAVATNQSLFTSGSILKAVIGLVIISGALWALYARWDAGGRPTPWGKKKG